MGENVVILLPLPLKSHFDQMMQLGRLLWSSKGGFSINVICTRFNSPDPALYPHFTFHVIADSVSSKFDLGNGELFLVDLNRSCVEQLRECLSGIVSAASSSTTCLITDSFWYSSQAVATSLGLPRLVLDVNISFFLTTIQHQHLKHLSKHDKEARVEEVFPLKIKDLPMLKARDETLSDELMLSILREIKGSEGIIFNSFKELEADALAKVEDALSIPVFVCGPIDVFGASTSGAAITSAPASCIFPWLDTQPQDSVLYISLGTIVSMDKSEFLELAWGIAASNRPFLWSVRPGLVRGSNQRDPVLPEEFMRSVEGRGLVVSWAPQNKVLAHPSVGGFWTHGGWNSILESIQAGVPMICLPFFGDQMSNARYVSDVWKIGLYFEEVKVERPEVAKAIKRLMVHKDGVEMRQEAASWKNKLKNCVEPGGSSYESLDKLVQYVRNWCSYNKRLY